MVVCAKLVASLARPTVQFKTKYVCELVKALVKGIRHVLTVDGYRLKTEGERKAIDHIVDLFVPLGDADAVKCVKYLTAIYLPRLTGDVEPERPEFLTETATLFTHEYRRYIGRLFANHGRVTRRQLSLAFSILQIKRYLPALPKSLKIESAIAMKKRLTTPGVTPEILLEQLDRTANELFPRGWDAKVPIPSYTVSNKSCFEATRASGGIQDAVFDMPSKFGGCAYDQIIDFEAKSIYGDFDDTLPVHPNTMTPEQFHETACRTQPWPLRAGVEMVDDPLKARAITKNNWQCNALKPLQKMIHNRLRQHQSFRLIGEPLTEDVINVLDRFPGSMYVSGDYEAATDNFHKDATESVLHTILGNMTGTLARDIEFQMLAKRSLTGLTVSHSKAWIDEFVMNRGQLMGSLLSFPILCIVNFAIWRHSTERSHRTRCNGLGMGGRFDHVLINGDDIGFCATPTAWKLWTSLTPQVGLKPSLGKNYFCKEFITLNTLLFSYSVTLKRLTKVKFTNLGLLRPPGEETLLENQDALGSMHDDFVEGCGDRIAASGVFISEHKDLLKLSWRNLYGPRELGGLGAHPVKGSKGESYEGYSVRQLVIADLLDSGKGKMSAGGLVGRYDSFQKRYLDKVFPNVQRATSDTYLDEPLPGFRWEDVSELVGEASIHFKSMVSWLAPYNGVPRPLWRGLNRLRTLADEYISKNEEGEVYRRRIPIQRYLETRGEILLYRQVCALVGFETMDTGLF